MANDPKGDTSEDAVFEDTNLEVTDQPLVLTELASEKEPYPQPKRWTRVELWRTIMIAAALAIIGAFAVWAWLNRDTLGQPEPIPAEFQAWGTTCGPALNTCAGDLVLFKDGRRWVVEGTANDYVTFNSISADRFASVEDIVSLEDVDYVDALRAYYGRTAPRAQEPGAAQAPTPPSQDAEPAPTVAPEEQVQPSPAFP